ncbi:uncharacterized protein BXZ73DRAFT_100517 [Epithele typhae]|uniref:uncharacterized protein n=1 Tax=Epithele typhae TaxID=378194 RepID=UPI0020084D1D|nr:uncharacterized protein BXZ73DRAFT_100517 [Epithele typhae]KAH9935124.1 hypothetical protein BXZ73DRAFT_100517 [Epithele typhae]
MADFTSIFGIVSGVIGIIATALTIYLLCTPSNTLICQAETKCNDTRDYLKKLFAEGLLDDDFFVKKSKDIDQIEDKIMMQRGQLTVSRWWWNRFHFWVTTWSDMDRYSGELALIGAIAARRASEMRKRLRLHPSQGPVGSTNDSESRSETRTASITNNTALDKLECGTLGFSSPPSSTSDRRKYSFVKVNLKRYWSAWLFSPTPAAGALRLSPARSPDIEDTLLALVPPDPLLGPPHGLRVDSVSPLSLVAVMWSPVTP